jgi:hypothetical protein
MTLPNGALVHHLGATSASLLHPDEHRMAGYNLYDVQCSGLQSVRARVWDPKLGAFTDGVVPRRPVL